MDSFYSRDEYPRYISRRNRKDDDQGQFTKKIIRQTIISAMIILVVWYLGGMNTPASRFFTNQVRWVVEKDISPKTVYQGVTGSFKGVFGKLGIGLTAQKGNDTDGRTGDGTNNGGYGAWKGVMEFVYPLQGDIIAQYGEREDPQTGATGFHCGIDIAARGISVIKAAKEGRVTEVGESQLYGRYLKIYHGNGWTTVYGNCSEILAEEGDEVEKGEVIAEINSPEGNGAHLHFEIWKGEMPVDPGEYLE